MRAQLGSSHAAIQAERTYGTHEADVSPVAHAAYCSPIPCCQSTPGFEFRYLSKSESPAPAPSVECIRIPTYGAAFRPPTDGLRLKHSRHLDTLKRSPNRMAGIQRVGWWRLSRNENTSGDGERRRSEWPPNRPCLRRAGSSDGPGRSTVGAGASHRNNRSAAADG